MLLYACLSRFFQTIFFGEILFRKGDGVFPICRVKVQKNKNALCQADFGGLKIKIIFIKYSTNPKNLFYSRKK